MFHNNLDASKQGFFKPFRCLDITRVPSEQYDTRKNENNVKIYVKDFLYQSK